jgi:hypothetical protein
VRTLLSARARAFVTLAVALGCAPAQAHLNSTGMGPIYDGLTHWLMRRNVWSSLRRIWSGGGVAYLAKAIGNTLHTVGPMSRRIF